MKRILSVRRYLYKHKTNKDTAGNKINENAKIIIKNRRIFYE